MIFRLHLQAVAAAFHLALWHQGLPAVYVLTASKSLLLHKEHRRGTAGLQARQQQQE
jgi:hypothetical protein